MGEPQTLAVRVRRRHRAGDAERWETFAVPRDDEMTVAEVLSAINRAPRTIDAQPTAPIIWSSACTWPACGTCTMLINGRAAPACGTTVGQAVSGRANARTGARRWTTSKRAKLVLAPMTGFPVLKDLWVDRSRMRDDATRVEGFVNDATVEPMREGSVRSAVLAFSACTRCGACVDACPEAHPKAAFVGPYALGAVHATRLTRGTLPRSILEAGGIADCGHVQNCIEVCPERIPLDRAVSSAAQAGFKGWLSALLGSKPREAE